MSSNDKKQYLECGKIINTHGVKGAVKLEAWCDDPYTLAELDFIYFNEDNTFVKKRITSATVMKRHVMAYIDGIDDIDQAVALKNTVIYADRDDIALDEGDYFIVDLIGLPVIDADTNIEYGVISEVFNTGASDIYTVKTPDGERMIPAVPEFIIEIDINKGVRVRPIEGMFD